MLTDSFPGASAREFYPKLRAALPPERRHLVDTEVRHFESLYEDHWPETFVPTAAAPRL